MTANTRPLTDRQKRCRELCSDLPVLVPASRVAKFFNVSPRTVTRWLRDGRLTRIKTSSGYSGRGVVVARPDIERLLEAMMS